MTIGRQGDSEPDGFDASIGPFSSSNESSDVGSRFWCPGCDEEVRVSPETIGQLVRCPYCNQNFFASDEHSHQAVVDDTPEVFDDRGNELDTHRVRLLSARRMTIVRAASWWLIGLIMSITAMTAFTLKAVRIAREDQHWGPWPTGCMVVVATALWLARKCARELKAARIEIAPPVRN